MHGKHVSVDITRWNNANNREDDDNSNNYSISMPAQQHGLIAVEILMITNVSSKMFDEHGNDNERFTSILLAKYLTLSRC